MAKRFTDTEKYKKDFFKSLPGAYKLLWDYLYHDCDNAGIWIKDFEIAQIRVGKDMSITEAEALKLFGDRVIVFDSGKKWFIPSYIEFQYECEISALNPKNNAHLSVIKKLTKEGLMSPSRGAQDKDKDKEEDKDIIYLKERNKKFFDMLLPDQRWAEDISRIHKIPVEHVPGKLDLFLSHQNNRKVRSNNLKDFAGHFDSWLRIELSKEAKNNLATILKKIPTDDEYKRTA